jgi:Ca2+-transporting ATPase
MTDLNLINSRVAGQDTSVFDGLCSNPYFIVLFILILIVHVVLSHFASLAFQTVKIPLKFWGYSLAFAVAELFVGGLLRLIRLTDRTTEKLEALRAQRADHIKQFYAGIPGPQQWEMSSLEGADL